MQLELKVSYNKLNPWKLAFWKQTIISDDEAKVSVTLANKYKVKPRISSFRSFNFLSSFYSTKVAAEVLYEKNCSWKFHKIYKKTPVPEPLFSGRPEACNSI